MDGMLKRHGTSQGFSRALGVQTQKSYLSTSKAFIVPGIVPEQYLDVLRTIQHGMNGI